MERVDACRALLAKRACRILQLRPGHWHRLEIYTLPRADSLAARILEPAITRSGIEGTISLGMAVLSPGEDGQDLLPADESRRSRAPQGNHAGECALRRRGLPGR